MPLFEDTYSPFDDDQSNKKTIFQVNFQDLNQLKLKDIDEGIYIEYKEELSSSVLDKIPKIITSFANERGGWLFIGINDQKEIIPIIERDWENDINNKLNAVTSPIPLTVVRFLKENIIDTSGVLTIWTPEGKKTPYFANGSVYSRVGSGSQPQTNTREGYVTIKDRYYIDQLYRKSEQNIEQLRRFCKKDIAIKKPIKRDSPINYRDLGICNIYIIPKYDLKLYLLDEKSEIIDPIIQGSQLPRQYKLADLEISFNIGFSDYSLSLNSIIFRHSKTLDHFEKTMAWELFLNGDSKFHIPIPYLELTNERLEFLKENCNNFEHAGIFKHFDYVDGQKFLFALFACIDFYVKSMRELSATFDDVVIAIELLNIQKSSLFFQSEEYKGLLATRGIKFSERENYFINENFYPSKPHTDDLMWFFEHITEVSRAFGFSERESIMCILTSQTI